MLSQVIKKYNYKILLTDITTDYGTTIDNVITNVNLSAIVYKSLISDHKPIISTDIDICIRTENNINLENTESVNSFTKNSILESINYQST